jgi:hypothetical protein
MKKIYLLALFLTGPFFVTSFAQAQSVNCKISESFSVSASYSENTQIVHVIKTENGETADFKGISFEQFDKIHLNKNSALIKLAQDAAIDVSHANSASLFVLQKSDTSVSQLVEFVNIDGESLGIAAMIGPKIQKCL